MNMRIFHRFKVCMIPVDLLIYASALIAGIGFYLILRRIPPDGPVFLLAPISWLSGMLSGSEFVFVSGMGYLGMSPSGAPVVIEKSCSGGTFLISEFLLLVFTLIRGFTDTKAKFCAYIAVLGFSYFAAVAASSLRIAVSMLLLNTRVGLSPVLMHNLIGISTYLSAMCAAYFAARRLAGKYMRER